MKHFFFPTPPIMSPFSLFDLVVSQLRWARKDLQGLGWRGCSKSGKPDNLQHDYNQLLFVCDLVAVSDGDQVIHA